MTIAPGAALPAVTAQDASGAPPVALAALADRGPALLFVYKGDCPASTLGAAVLPRFAAIPGLVIVGLSQDGPEEALRFAAAQGWGGAVRALVDPEPWPVSDALGIASTPTWILVARGGRVKVVCEGWSRDDANALAARAAALAGAPPPLVARPNDEGPPFRPG